MKRFIAAAALLLFGSAAAVSAGEVGITLRGSRASMERQNAVARAKAYSFLRTARQVMQFADAGRLVPVSGNSDYRVLASWPYARPVVRDFVDVLAGQYRDACGEQLVVTSLTRPAAKQPRNASPLSVHPAGMAVDLRVSSAAGCVDWLEAELLMLEQQGLIDATREYYPPHFHVAVFPAEFRDYLATRSADSARAAVAHLDSLRLFEHRQLLAAMPPLPVLLAAPAPALGWSDVLLVLARALLRV
jgi:hypothetical protein